MISKGIPVSIENWAARTEYGRAFALPDPSRCPEVGATLYETVRRATRRLLEAALKWVGITSLLVSFALIVYLGAVLIARLSVWASFP